MVFDGYKDLKTIKRSLSFKKTHTRYIALVKYLLFPSVHGGVNISNYLKNRNIIIIKICYICSLFGITTYYTNHYIVLSVVLRLCLKKTLCASLFKP